VTNRRNEIVAGGGREPAGGAGRGTAPGPRRGRPGGAYPPPGAGRPGGGPSGVYSPRRREARGPGPPAVPEQEGLPGGGAVLPSAGAGAGLGCAAGGGGRRARGPLLRPGPVQVRRPAHFAGAG